MTQAIGTRRKARERALQMLYSLDLNDTLTVGQALGVFWRDFDEEAHDPQVVTFAEALVSGTHSHLEELDAVIQRASKNWRVERMAKVDRNILRLAAYELAHAPDVPAKVVINEAIELAKRFGASESAAFVNGVLDRLAQELKRS